MKNQALILGGGSVKGCYEAGVVKAVLESGYTPKIISGISVGSLNGAYMVNAKGLKNNWVQVGSMLWDFWIDKIQSPKDVAVKRKTIPLLWSLLTKKFNGLTDTYPIDNLIRETVSVEVMRKSGVDFSVGAVNLNSANIVYAQAYMTNFVDYILASKAIPFAMPVQKIGLQTYVDGGLIDSAPIGQAIKKEATEIIVVGTNPENLGGAEINSGNPIEFADRLVEIIVNNTLNNDIKVAQLTNELCPKDGSPKPDEPFKGKRRVPITVIRPEVPVSIDLTGFDTSDIKRLLDAGYNQGKEILK